MLKKRGMLKKRMIVYVESLRGQTPGGLDR
jgi:hypothetical protein